MYSSLVLLTCQWQTDPPPWGWVGGMGQGVPAEEHETEFIFKGFSSLIFCVSSSVLGVDFFVSRRNKKICVIGRFLLPDICIV